MKQLDEITGLIIDGALQIHKGLGPGLLESVYESVLARALERGGLRMVLLVEDSVIVELKSAEYLARDHRRTESRARGRGGRQ